MSPKRKKRKPASKMDPDLKRLNELWPQLTKWQRKKIYYRFRFGLLKIQLRNRIRSIFTKRSPQKKSATA